MDSPAGSGARFLTTRWNLVRDAGRDASPESRAALEELCRAYWYPLYAYLRRSGERPDDARDLVQGFFARFLARNDLGAVREDGGRFRAYLLAALRHHRSNERERARAEKRGGGIDPLSLDFAGAEERYAREPSSSSTPESLYARKWALALLEGVLARLAEEQSAKGRAAAFEALKPFLGGGEEGERLTDAARALDITYGAARVAVHRLRARYREILLAEVAATVDRPQDVEAELAELFATLAADGG